MAGKNKLSIYISFLLRHNPQAVGLEMDRHGWVSTEALIAGINTERKYRISMELLEQIVAEDAKGRYRFNEDKSRIKACQGHSIPWVEPELEYKAPPQYLYHGTTTDSLQMIMNSGFILKMKRHAVHMQAQEDKAWQSARRWKQATPVVLQIDAEKMHRDGFVFGVSDNEVWCAEKVPVGYICGMLYQPVDVAKK